MPITLATRMIIERKLPWVSPTQSSKVRNGDIHLLCACQETRRIHASREVPQRELRGCSGETNINKNQKKLCHAFLIRDFGAKTQICPGVYQHSVH